MSLLIAACPRCGAKQMTFDVLSQVHLFTREPWQNWFEIFCQCRACSRPTIFLISHDNNVNPGLTQQDGLANYPGSLNKYVKIERFISIRDNVSIKPPEHLPPEIENAFTEGAACLSIDCFNAAAVMFRLCVDLATRPLLPDSGDDTKALPNAKQRRDLGLRLPWLFDNKLLPVEFEGSGRMYQRGR